MPNKRQPVPGGADEPSDLQRRMGALHSPIRREILRLIWDGDLPAGAIAAAFSVTKPTISQHLAVLRDAGLVTSTAVGTSRRYRARPEALEGLRGALGNPARWTPADDVPERALASARTELVVVASAEVATDQASTFRAFLDPVVYSRWMGVPVTIEDGRFACTLEWGTQVRGRYEVVSPPDLIAMRWDFDDEAVPVPGGDTIAYLRVAPRAGGAAVTVHQVVSTREKAEFMQAAWSLVLGRLTTGVAAALESDGTMTRRPSRPKRRRA